MKMILSIQAKYSAAIECFDKALGINPVLVDAEDNISR
jgi:hypothetical protein